MTKIYDKKPEPVTTIFPTITQIYQDSKINWDDYYKSVIALSVRTSNNFQIIEDMEFHKFNSLMKYLNIYIEEENKQNNDGNAANEKMDDIKAKSNQMLADAKKQQKVKTPKIPKK